MKPWALAAVAMVLSTSPGAHAFADWQGTTWNISLEQADKVFLISHRHPTQAEIDRWRPQEIGLVFDDYTAGDLAFHEGALLFQAGRLSGVSFQLKDAGACEKLIAVLREIYGRPALELRVTSLHSVKWYDGKNHNEVNADSISTEKLSTNHCGLRYLPFIVPDPGQF